AAPWYVLGAVLLGCAVRAIDLESCALFIPGGLYGTAKTAFGRPVARLAASCLVAELLLFGGLTASAAGHSLVTIGTILRVVPASPQQMSLDDLSTVLAASVIALVWLWLRQGRLVPSGLVRRTAVSVTSGVSLYVLAQTAAMLLGHHAMPLTIAPAAAGSVS